MKKNTQAVAMSKPILWEKYIHIILCAFAFLLYANTIGNGYNMDDELVTRKHKFTSKGIEAIPEIFTNPYYSDAMGYSYEYRPMVLVSFAIEHQIFGDSPKTSHFINVLLYVITVLVLFKLLRKLLQAYSYWYSVLIVLLFIVHPLHTEVIASIKNRDEILAFLCALGAWWFALGFAEKGKWWRALLVPLLFLAGVLSKMSIIPCMMLIPLSLVFFSTISGKKILLLGVLMAISVYPFLTIPNKADPVFLIIYIAAMLFPWCCLMIKDGGILHVFQVGKITFQKIKMRVSDNRITYTEVADTPLIFKPFVLNRAELFQVPFLLILFSLLAGSAFYIWDHVAFVPVAWFLLFGIVFFMSNASQRNLLLPIFTLMFLCVCYFSYHHLYIDLGLGLLLFVYLFYTNLRSVILLLCITAFIPFYFYFERPTDFLILVLIFIVLLLRDKNRFFSWGLYVVAIIVSGVIITDLYAVLFQGTSWESVLSNLILFILVLSAIIKRIPKFQIPVLLLVFIPFIHLVDEANKDLSIIEPQAKPTNTIVKAAVSDTSDASFYNMVPHEERPILFAEIPLSADSPIDERLGMSADVLGFYLKKMVVPYPMGYYYGYAFFKPTSLYELGPLFSLVLHLILLVVALLFIKKHPPLSFGILFYLGCIILFSGFMYPVVGVAGDRFTYTASLGWALALAYLILRFTVARKTWPTVNKVSPVFLGSVAFLLAIYALITLVRNTEWKSAIALMENDIEHLDESAQAHNLYALNLMRESVENKKLIPQKRLEYQKEAIIHFDKALQIWPDFFNAAYDKGRASMMIGDYVSAIDGFEKAVAIGPEEGFIDPYMQLSQLYEQTGRYKDYLVNAKKVLQIKNEAQAYNMVAKGYYVTGHLDSAKIFLRRGMAQFPEDVSLRKNIAEIFRAESQEDSLHYYLQR